MFNEFNVPKLDERFVRFIGFNKISPRACKDGDDAFYAQASTHIEYSNETNRPLFIHDRYGVKNAIWPVARGSKDANFDIKDVINKPIHDLLPSTGQLRVRVSFVVDYKDLEEIVERWSDYTALSEFYLKIRNAFRRANEDNYVKGNAVERLISITVEIIIPAAMINQDKPLFIRELGLTIGHLKNKETAFSTAAFPHLYRQSEIHDDKVGYDPDDPAFHCFKAYVKRKDYIGRLYVRLFDTVMEIPVIYDPTGERHGIEVFSKRRVTKDGMDVEQQVQLYTFEEAEERFGIKDNIAAAFKFHEEDLARIRHEREMKEERFKSETLEYNFQKLKHEKEEREAEHQRTIELHNKKVQEMETKAMRDSERYQLEIEELEKKHKREMEALEAKAKAEAIRAKADAEATAAKIKMEKETNEQRRKLGVLEFFKSMFSAVITVTSSFLTLAKFAAK